MDGKKPANVNYAMKVLLCFGMTFIVSGHIVTAGNAGPSFAYNLFPPASFHVALFLFASGYFFKSKHKEHIAVYIKRRFVRLMVPLYALTAVYAIWTTFAHSIGFSIGQNVTLYNLLLDPLFGGHAFMWNLCLWFVAPLFFVQVIDVCIRRVFHINDSAIKNLILTAFYFVVAFITVSLMLKLYGVDGFEAYSSSPLILLARVGFLIFWYGLGQCYKVVFEKYDNASNLLYFSIVVTLQVIGIVLSHGNVGYVISWCGFNSGHYMPFVASVLGIAFWLRISKLLAPVLKQSKAMNFFADNTFSVMAHQFVGIMFVKSLLAFLASWGLIQGFDFALMSSDIWYYYVPAALYNSPSASIFCTLYLAGGIGIPLGIHWLWIRIYNPLKAKCIKKS